MPDYESLAEALLDQNSGCSWIASAEGEFLRIYGDSRPAFGVAASSMVGRRLTEFLDRASASVWRDRFARALAGERLALHERRDDVIWVFSVFPVKHQKAGLYVGGFAQQMTAWGNAEQELRTTVLSALKSQEYERRMTASFLHDKVGQNLTACGLQLDLVRMDLETTSPAVAARIADTQRLVDNMMEDVRNFSYELNPAIVERAGLRAALDRLAARLRGRFAGTIRLNVDPNFGIEPKTAVAMYQISQEAIRNSVQHSSCSVIEIAVKSTRTGPLLEIRDNGRGFDPADIGAGRRGLGLLSMEHYAVEAGLSLVIQSSRGMGATVRAFVPESK